MSIELNVKVDDLSLITPFTTSSGVKNTTSVIRCGLRDDYGHEGFGECVPSEKDGETIKSVLAEIEAICPVLEQGITRDELCFTMVPGAARNAIDCALWDLDAKRTGTPVYRMLALAPPVPLITAYTISLAEPNEMALQAARNSARRLLKVKVGTSDDAARIRAVRSAAPDSTLIVDANEGWTLDNLTSHFAVCASEGVALVEQPLPAGRDEALSSFSRTVPICADESARHDADLTELATRYDAINIKLDKVGGLTSSVRVRQEAERLGMKVMVGCRIGTSLSMAPALLLAQGADFVDLDGPLLLSRDRDFGLKYEESLVFPSPQSLWG
ncbi:N-acetyl-D-Glu racemase DgcA [Agrobacterium tumefaciens]|uniref:N-acetyl-D-Glu racemase DgcA n=1 Tax=Agrobacterium tumefaciens TaxID=358 RepID=UPI002244AE0E|nr:N-acetyl-D-Glu racemase DgcA [Agrobacterium tumefaciens]MCW8059143.1 dipeptide epimerase [Agrobacterium tumefaciens]MCW8143385.1 dipeptide epimerase [Agrobacterium tumefaciens]